MIVFERLHVEGFGPYQHPQDVELGRVINIVEGANGSGKTNLFKALRFAVYGEPEEEPTADLESFVNNANRKRGRHEFKAILTFSFIDGKGEQRKGELTRIYSGRDAGDSLETFMAVNGEVLSQKAAYNLVSQLFPRNLASFYFFETERLRQYQGGSAAASDVKDTIERLLGIPAIDAAKTDASAARQAAVQKIAEAASQNAEVQKWMSKLDMARERERAIANGLKDAQEDRQKHIDALGEVEADLKRFEHFGQLSEMKQEAERRRDAAKARIDSAKEQISDRSSNAWIGVLEEDLRAMRDELQGEFEKVASDYGRRRVLQAELMHLRDSMTCPTCGSSLDDDTRDRTIGRIAREIGDDPASDIREALATVSGQIQRIQKILDSSASASLRAAAEEIVKASVELQDAEAEIARREKEIRDTNLRGQDYEKLIERRIKLQMLEEETSRAINEQTKDLSEIQSTVRTLEKKIEDAAGAEVPSSVMALSKAAGVLEKVFEDASRHARRLLRQEIQERASEFFRRVSAVKGYEGLDLDDAYRATIVDAAGEPVESPSSGYQHLVVLSLVSALMRTSPTPGPVVMDMPFGRLDAKRTSDVVRALPALSDQVIILVFDEEFGDDDLNMIKDEVYAVYDIKQRNWDDSYIVPREEWQVT